MEINFITLFLSGLIPLVVGAIWYNPNVMGKAWMAASGKTEEELAKGNMAVIFGLTYFLGLMLALALSGMTNHQSGVMQLFAEHPDFGTAGSEAQNLYDQVMAMFGDSHRTLGHGALHGAFGAVFLALPLIAINAMFERRGGKYIGIHFGYWLLTFVAVGAVVCAYL